MHELVTTPFFCGVEVKTYYDIYCENSSKLSLQVYEENAGASLRAAYTLMSFCKQAKQNLSIINYFGIKYLSVTDNDVALR